MVDHLFYLFLFSTLFLVSYKILSEKGYIPKNTWVQNILDFLLFIPKILYTLVYSLGQSIGLFKQNTSNGTSIGTIFENRMLLISVLLLSGYFIWYSIAYPYLQDMYLKQGGLQLINQPITTSKLTNVASYETLNNNNKKSYQYALSFWFYLDSFATNTNNSYIHSAPIVSYGGNPCIKYSAKTNTLFVTIKNNNNNKNKGKDKNKKQKIELDDTGDIIIYKKEGIMLQKWNQILINYNGGTLDVFYNGKLVKSAIHIVPYISLDLLQVGAEEGISGNVANLMYFTKPLELITIDRLYTNFLDKNPPTISTNDNTLLSPII